jgi:hypothetical protein
MVSANDSSGPDVLGRRAGEGAVGSRQLSGGRSMAYEAGGAPAIVLSSLPISREPWSGLKSAPQRGHQGGKRLSASAGTR